jgi:ABC-2 type transport system ATP-binding protein
MEKSHNSKVSRSQVEVLLAEDLWKSYGPRPALKGLSFSLKAGRILGFLGPNGAGKTTAIRILTTILAGDSGRFVVDGITSEHPEMIRQRIGVLPESLGFHKQMTGLECLTFFGRLYGRGADEARTIGAALLKDVGLDQRARSLVGTYSRGMRQRLGIARALVNDPVVVFLDEPTLGLDPRGQQELLDLVRWIARERNAGVILCSHDLPEVESVCDDVVILSSGQVVASGTVGEVIGKTQGKVVLGNGIQIQVPAQSMEKARQVLGSVTDIVEVTSEGDKEGWLRVELKNSADRTSTEEHLVNNQILEALIRAKIPILRFEAEGGRLQDVFLHLTEEIIA